MEPAKGSKIRAETGKRSDNWTSSEVEKLKQEIEFRYETLFGKFSSSLSRETKLRHWNEITEAVNKVSKTVRTLEKVQKKWTNIKTTSKESIAEKISKADFCATGGGPSKPHFTPGEERMLGIIGKTAVIGVEGGYDTSKLKKTVVSSLIEIEVSSQPLWGESQSFYNDEDNIEDTFILSHADELTVQTEDAVIEIPRQSKETESKSSTKRAASSRNSIAPKKLKKSVNMLLLEEQRSIRKTLSSMLGVMEKNVDVNEQRLKIVTELLELKKLKYLLK